MRWIKHIVVHSTGTDTTKKAKHFFNDGKPLYHFVIERDGEIITTKHEQAVVETFIKDDLSSIHIAYVGGVDKNGKPVCNISSLQKEALFLKLVALSSHYYNAKIVGADELNLPSNSPCFNVREWMNQYEPNFCLDKETFSMAA